MASLGFKASSCWFWSRRRLASCPVVSCMKIAHSKWHMAVINYYRIITIMFMERRRTLLLVFDQKLASRITIPITGLLAGFFNDHQPAAPGAGRNTRALNRCLFDGWMDGYPWRCIELLIDYHMLLATVEFQFGMHDRTITRKHHRPCSLLSNHTLFAGLLLMPCQITMDWWSIQWRCLVRCIFLFLIF